MKSNETEISILELILFQKNLGIPQELILFSGNECTFTIFNSALVRRDHSELDMPRIDDHDGHT